MKARTAIRGVFRLFAGLVLLIVVAVAGVLAFLHIDRGRAFVRNQVVSALDDLLAGRLEIGSIEGSLLDEFSLRHVVLYDGEERVAAEVDLITVDTDLWQLINNEVAIEHVSAEGVRVHAYRNPDGSLNLAQLVAPQPEEPDTGPSPWVIDIDQVTVLDGAFSITEPDGSTSLSVRDFGLDGELLTGGGHVHVAVDELRARWDDVARDALVRATFGIHDGAVTAYGVEARLGEGRVLAPLAYFDWQKMRLLALAAADVPVALVDDLAPDTGLLSDISLVTAALRIDDSLPIWFALSADAGGGRVQALGAAEPEIPAASLRLGAEGVDLGRIMRGTPSTELALSADAELRGSELETMTLRADVLARGSLDGERIPDLRAHVDLVDARAAGELHLEADDTVVHASGAALLGGEVVVVENGRVEATIPSISAVLARIPGLPPEIRANGSVYADLRASGPVDALAVTGELEGVALDYSGSRVDVLKLQLDLSGVPNAIEGRANLEALGVVQGPTRIGNLRARVRASDPRDLDVRVEIGGEEAFVPLAIAARVRQGEDSTRVALGDYRFTTGQLTWTGSGGGLSIGPDGAVRVNEIGLSSDAGRIHVGSANIRGEARAEVALDLDELDLAKVDRAIESLIGNSVIPLSGLVSLQVQAGKRGQRLRGDLAVEGAELAMSDNVPPVTAAARVSLAADSLRLQLDASSAPLGKLHLDTSLRPPRATLNPNAWASLDERALLSFDLSLSEIDIARIREWKPEAMPGFLAGEVAVAVSADEGMRNVELQVSAANFQHAALGTPIDGQIETIVADGVATLNGHLTTPQRGGVDLYATADLPKRLLDTDAWSKMDERSLEKLSVSAHDVDLDFWLSLGGVDSELGARASLTLDAHDYGQRVESKARVEVPAQPERSLPAFALELDTAVRRKDLDVALALVIERETYLDGEVALAIGLDDLLHGDPARATTSAAEIDLGIRQLPLRLISEVLELPAPLGGSLQGEAKLTGSLSEPSVEVDLAGDRIAVANTEFRVFRLGGQYNGDGVRVRFQGDQGAGGELAIDSVIRLGEEGARGEADLRAQGFDIGFLGDLVPNLYIGGALDADVHIDGNGATPVATGSLALSEGVFHAGPPMRQFREIELALDLRGDSIVLEKLEAKSGAGDLRIDGRVALAGIMPDEFEFHIATDDLPLEFGATIVELDSRIHIAEGKYTGDAWTTTVNIERAYGELPKEQGRELHDAEVPEDIVFVDGRCVELVSCAETVAFEDPKGEEEELVEAPLPPLLIRVRANDTIQVRTEEALAVFGAELDIDTRSGDMAINGAVAANFGHLELFGRRYEIQRASVSFGSAPGRIPNPSLDVLLSHEFPSLTLYIGVTGTASDPELMLRSEPGVYDEATLLSFVLGASPLSEDEGIEGEEPALSDRAVGVASSLVVGQVQGLIEDVLPIELDVLRVELADSSAAAEKVIIGKWITNKLFLSYARNFDAAPEENVGEASLEYRFRKRWMLEGRFGDRGAGGLDLLWTKRF